jgi:hypothetical protein
MADGPGPSVCAVVEHRFACVLPGTPEGSALALRSTWKVTTVPTLLAGAAPPPAGQSYRLIDPIARRVRGGHSPALRHRGRWGTRWRAVCPHRCSACCCPRTCGGRISAPLWRCGTCRVASRFPALSLAFASVSPSADMYAGAMLCVPLQRRLEGDCRHLRGRAIRRLPADRLYGAFFRVLTALDCPSIALL